MSSWEGAPTSDGAGSPHATTMAATTASAATDRKATSARRCPISGIEHQWLAREPRQALHPTAGRIEQDQVFDPDAGLVLEIDPGLDREDRRRRQWRVQRGHPQRRRLVRREPDPVPESVSIRRPAPVAVNHASRDLVEVPAG